MSDTNNGIAFGRKHTVVVKLLTTKIHEFGINCFNRGKCNGAFPTQEEAYTAILDAWEKWADIPEPPGEANVKEN